MKIQLAVSMVSALSLGACIDQPGDVDEASAPRLSSNALMPSKIIGVNWSQAALTSDVINSTAGTADGRDFINYIVGCAYNTSQSITTTVGGVNYTFTGAMGLATNWPNAALSSSEEKWVSACVIARSNLTGTVVQISMRGGVTALNTTSSERLNYQVNEGAFYGNIFSTPIVEAACMGPDQAHDNTQSTLPQRKCAAQDPNNLSKSLCNFQYRNLCSTTCTLSSGNYTNCTDAGGTTYAEVATILLYGTPTP